MPGLGSIGTDVVCSLLFCRCYCVLLLVLCADSDPHAQAGEPLDTQAGSAQQDEHSCRLTAELHIFADKQLRKL